MWLGKVQLGTYLDFYLQCTDADEVKSMPVYVPFLKVWIASSLIHAAEMPLLDKTSQVGLFATHLFLGNEFDVGYGTAEMYYQVGGKFGIETRTFEIVPGGHVDGQVLGMFFYQKPAAEFVVYQTEAGTLRKGKNPRVS